MFTQCKNYIVRHRAFFSRLLLIILGVCVANEASAETIQSISKNVDSGITSLAKVLQDVALITGIGFILASFFKFHQHKLNPQQVPMSQGVTLLVIGAGLAVFPHLLDTATQGVFGTNTSRVGGSAISTLIGGS